MRRLLKENDETNHYLYSYGHYKIEAIEGFIDEYEIGNDSNVIKDTYEDNVSFLQIEKTFEDIEDLKKWLTNNLGVKIEYLYMNNTDRQFYNYGDFHLVFEILVDENKKPVQPNSKIEDAIYNGEAQGFLQVYYIECRGEITIEMSNEKHSIEESSAVLDVEIGLDSNYIY